MVSLEVIEKTDAAKIQDSARNRYLMLKSIKRHEKVVMYLQKENELENFVVDEKLSVFWLKRFRQGKNLFWEVELEKEE